jgi:hypothetical protein
MRAEAVCGVFSSSVWAVWRLLALDLAYLDTWRQTPQPLPRSPNVPHLCQKTFRRRRKRMNGQKKCGALIDMTPMGMGVLRAWSF